MDENFPFDVFISHSTKDKAVADAVVSAHEKVGIRCWYAPRDIPPGADWADAITKAIEECSLMVLIFSGSANGSQRVLDELNFAIKKGKPVLPFRVEDLEPTGAMELHLSSRHWLDAYHPSWEAHIERLVKSVQANLDVEVGGEVEIQEPKAGMVVAETPSKGRILRIIGLIAAGIIALAVLTFIGWNTFGGGNIPPTPSPRLSGEPVLVENPIKVGLLMVYDSPYGGVFNQKVLEGIQRAEEELGVVIDYIEIRQAEESMEFIDDFVEKDIDVIITAGFIFHDVTVQAAELYSDVNFIAIDQVELLGQDHTNIAVLLFEPDKMGFLAGALAGLLSESGTVGSFYGPKDLDPIVAGKEGFEAGVAYIDSRIEVISKYYDSSYDEWLTDPDWYDAEARKAVNNGADVIFSYAGPPGWSALETAALFDDVYCIGSEWDLWGEIANARPCLVTSITNQISSAVFELIHMAQEGNSPSGVYYQGVDLTPYHDFEDEIPQDVQKQISAIRDKLVENKIDTGVTTAVDGFEQEEPPVVSATPETVEAPETIQSGLSYIGDHAPTFEDDFSEPKQEWGSFQNGYGIDTELDREQDISDVVWDGVLHVEGVPNQDGDVMTDFPYGDAWEELYAYNFVLEYEYVIENQPSGDDSEENHGFVIREDEDDHIGITINVENDLAQIYAGDSSWYEDIGPAGVAGMTRGTLRVIAVEEDIALYLDGNLIMTSKNREITGTRNMIRVFGEEYRLLIDNVKFWNLDEVEITNE
jgi:basic membrane protein A